MGDILFIDKGHVAPEIRISGRKKQIGQAVEYRPVRYCGNEDKVINQ
jgi:hypothetical protein